MSNEKANFTVAVVGATGSIGRFVVTEARAQGHTVRALVRSAHRASAFPNEIEQVTGDLTRPDSLVT